MPNLINVLPQRTGVGAIKMSDEERRKMLEKVLNGREIDNARGMEWGTCMVFSCENDCCRDLARREAKECWREEVVLIQTAI